MNRALLNPFEALKLPDTLELYLDTENRKATCMAFNRRGNVLAVGCTTGHIALWDFDTRASDKVPAAFVGGDPRDIPGEEAPFVPVGYHVTSVAFPAPRTGHFLVASFAANKPSEAAPTSSAASRAGVITRDNGTGLVRLCNTLAGTVITEIAFDVPILHVVPHPHRDYVMVAMPANMSPLLITIVPGRYTVPRSVYTTNPSPSNAHRIYEDTAAAAPTEVPKSPAPARPFVAVAMLYQEKDGSYSDPSGPPGLPGSVPAAMRRGLRAFMIPYPVSFSDCGKMLFRGSPSGVVHVFDFPPSEKPGDGPCQSNFAAARVANVFKVHGGAPICSLMLMRGRLLVNSFDRALRLFNVNGLKRPKGEEESDELFCPSVVTTFTEAVNRSQAKCACFSRDGDFVLAGMLTGNQHRIVVWRTSDGHPETVLEGPAEGITDLLWHPVQPVIASIGSQYGGVYVWAKNFTENWSAFAPEFTELEANEEYDETESEFDAKHPQNEEHVRAERELEEEKIIVDVEGSFGFSSDEENGDDSVVISLPTEEAKKTRFFYLPAVPVPDSNFAYPTTVDGKSVRDLVVPSRRNGSGAANGQGPDSANAASRIGKSPSQPLEIGVSRNNPHSKSETKKVKKRAQPSAGENGEGKKRSKLQKSRQMVEKSVQVVPSRDATGMPATLSDPEVATIGPSPVEAVVDGDGDRMDKTV